MRPLSSLAIPLAFAAAASAALAQANVKALDEYMTARAALGQFNGTVLVATSGAVIFEKAFGWSDFARGSKAETSTRYELASLTKAFTAAAILELQEAGKLSTSDLLCRWVTPCPDAWSAVTLSHLLHHTSGIPDYEESLDPETDLYRHFMLEPNSARRIIERERGLPLDFPPGSKFHYSNTAYVLLGTVVERASSMSYDRYLAETILRPAKLSGATFPSGGHPVPRLATGYSRLADDIRVVAAGITLGEGTTRPEPALPMDGPHGDARLIATAHDLWLWTRALEDSVVVSGNSLRAMVTPGLDNYGLGWFVGERWGRRMLSHTGFLPGYASIIEWYPESKTTVILVSNVVGPRLPLIARDLGAEVFGKPYDVRVARVAVPLDSASAARLAGVYTLSDGRLATVALRNDLITVSIPGAFNAGAFPVSRDEFYAPFFESTVRFERDADGAGRSIYIRFFGETWKGERRLQ